MKSKLMSLAVVGLIGVSTTAVSGTIRSESMDELTATSGAGPRVALGVARAEAQTANGRAKTDMVRVSIGNDREHNSSAALDGTHGIAPNTTVVNATPGHLKAVRGTSVSTDESVGTAPSSVPEPATLGLLGLGLAGVAFLRRPKSV